MALPRLTSNKNLAKLVNVVTAPKITKQVSGLTVPAVVATTTNAINEGYAKAGYELSQVDMLVAAGRSSQPVGPGRKGYDIGIGAGVASANPATVRATLPVSQIRGFDLAVSLQKGRATMELPPGITDPVQAFGFFTTGGMVGGDADANVAMMQTLASDQRAKEGAIAAIEEKEGLLEKVLRFFGLA